ncbi:MAG: O-antigen ligase family protein [Planctomycetota bacterium]|nr:O-antigen ligase family protein [Planctomycetota bacterium]
MRKRSRYPLKTSSAAQASVGDAGERLRPLWLSGVTALFVATPLIPSEAVPKGLGVSLLMAWFVLCAGFIVTGAVQRNLRLRIGAIEIAMLLFVALHTLSALVLADAGQPRQTLNMLWQWVGFAVAFLLVRQVVRTPRESRALVAVMIALSVCLSMHGYYQYFYSMPQARREYWADPEGELARARVVAEAGSVEREQFENRLESTEPMATFTLANSLAGFLAPWLLCAVGIAVLNWRNLELRRPLAVSAGVSGLLVAGCFILTKSRSATLAVLFGAGLLIVYGRRSGWRPGWKSVVAVIVLLAVLIALASSVGGLDLLVLTESSKSLLYRVQYWQASVAMIADAPWFGCGPGNFQQSYQVYKLPEASETVSDPHNFLVEIWSTAGTPAMLTFLGVLVCFASQLQTGLSASVTESARRETEDSGCVRAVYWGGLAGVPFGFIAGLAVGYVPDFALFVVGLPVAAAVVCAWHPWVLHGRLPIIVLVAAACVMLVNLSAAGGISFAGVALTLWLLSATALNLSEESRRGGTIPGRTAGAIAAATVVVALLFWYSTFAPVLNLSTILARAIDLQSQGRRLEAEQTLVAATTADHYSVEPWQALAQLRLEMWLDGGAASRETAFAEAARATLDHHRRSSAAHQSYGDWYLRAFRATNEERFLEEAIVGYRRATELYPNYNLGHAQLAWALQIAGRSAESSVEAAEALRLDGLNPHREQKLVKRAVFDAPRPGDLQSPNPPDTDAEQLMRELRSRLGN